MSAKNKEKRSPLGVICNIVGMLIIILVIVLCLMLTTPRLMGMNSYVVVSGSMEPSIPVGSLVISEDVNPASLEPGDVIVFYESSRGSTPITHRVVENDTENGEIITKGDANEQNDFDPIRYNNVIGKEKLHVPYLGYIASPLSTIMGKISVALLLIAAYLLTRITGRTEEDSEPKQE